MHQEEIVQKFAKKLGNTEFVSTSKLVDVGLYGSTAAVQKAVERGDFSCLHVSRHRTLILTQSVIDHIKRNLSIAKQIEVVHDTIQA
jgi:hypothetical protein